MLQGPELIPGLVNFLHGLKFLGEMFLLEIMTIETTYLLKLMRFWLLLLLMEVVLLGLEGLGFCRQFVDKLLALVLGLWYEGFGELVHFRVLSMAISYLLENLSSTFLFFSLDLFP